MKQPRWGNSCPSGERMTVRKIPPGRRSISHCDVVQGAGAHHVLTWSGSVQTFQISDRGASIVRSSERSRWPLLRVSLAMFLFLSLQSGDVCFHAIEATFPKRALLGQPTSSQTQGGWLHLARSYPARFLTANEATGFQHPKMLQQRRHRHAEWLGQLAHRSRAAAQPAHNRPTGRVRWGMKHSIKAHLVRHMPNYNELAP